jgi:hypothetical protein
MSSNDSAVRSNVLRFITMASRSTSTSSPSRCSTSRAWNEPAPRALRGRPINAEAFRARANLHLGRLASFALLPIGERPLAIVVGQTVAHTVPGVVEDDGLGLARGRTKRATDLLEVERQGLRRAKKNRGLDRGNIETLAKQVAIRQDGDLAGDEGRDGSVALSVIHLAINMGGCDASGAELVDDVFRMLDRDRERDGGLA